MAAAAAGLVVFRHPGLEHYQRLIEPARSRLADLELDYGVEKSKVDSVRCVPITGNATGCDF
jgi:hypothetical protein